MVARCAVRMVDKPSLQHRLGNGAEVFCKALNERTSAEESDDALQPSVGEDQGETIAKRLLRSVSDARIEASLCRQHYVSLAEELGGGLWPYHAESQSQVQGSQKRDGREVRDLLVEYFEGPKIHHDHARL